MFVALLAVHISDGILDWPWLALGFVVAALLLAWSSAKVPDCEIPRIGLITAAFFVASLIHVRAGPTSVHLLLNGLAGIILGRRSALAIGVGLCLQAILLGHGGFWTLGVNCCIITLPALIAGPVFRRLTHSEEYPSFRFRDGLLAFAYILHPSLMLPMLLFVVAGIRAQWRWHEDIDFQAGFVVGFGCVILTAILNAVVLVVAGTEDWRMVAMFVVAVHIPIAFIEGIVVGCTASFLRRVKPEMLSPFP